MISEKMLVVFRAVLTFLIRSVGISLKLQLGILFFLIKSVLGSFCFLVLTHKMAVERKPLKRSACWILPRLFHLNKTPSDVAVPSPHSQLRHEDDGWP